MLLMLWMGAAHPAGAQEMLTGQELVDALRLGGYNIYFRHAATDWSQDDHVSKTGEWTSCDPNRMRQLSDRGRRMAQRIGEAIKGLKIPIDRVYASEYCRTRETARYMDLGPVRPTRSIMNMRAAELVGGRQAVIEAARRLLSVPPKAGTNNIFIAHGNLMQATLGVYAGEMGAAVVAPEGDGDLRVVARLDPQALEALAAAFIPPAKSRQ